MSHIIKDAFSEGFRDGINHGIRHASEDFARVSPRHGIEDHWGASKSKERADNNEIHITLDQATNVVQKADFVLVDQHMVERMQRLVTAVRVRVPFDDRYPELSQECRDVFALITASKQAQESEK